MFFFWPLLAALAGTAVQAAGNQQAQNAAERATAAEVARQRRFQQEAQQAALASQMASTPEAVQHNINQGTQQAEQNYSKVESVPLSAAASQAPAQRSASVVNDTRKQAATQQSNQARAGLMGYNEWDLQRQIKNLLANSQLGMIGNFSQGSQGVLGSELASAQHAGDTLNGIGSLLGTIGSVGSMASMFNAPTAVTPPGGGGWQGFLGSANNMPTFSTSASPGGMLNYGQLFGGGL